MTISFDEWWDSNYRDFTGMSGSARWVASLAWNASRENIEDEAPALPMNDVREGILPPVHSVEWG